MYRNERLSGLIYIAFPVSCTNITHGTLQLLLAIINKKKVYVKIQ